MVEFPLKAVVTAVTTQASQSFDNLKSKLTGISDTTEASTQKQTAAWNRVKGTILGLTAASTGLLSAMIASSPELTAALSEIKFYFEEVANALGNALAPVVEALIPFIEDMTNWFINLSEPTKQFISLTIALTAVVGTLTIAIIALKAASFPVIALIIGIAAVIALLIVIFQNWEAIVNTATETWRTRMEDMRLVLSIFRDFFVATWQGIATFFSNVWDGIVSGVEAGWNFMVGLWESTVTVFGKIVDAITAPFKAAWNIIAGFINSTVIAFVNNNLIPAVNTILPKKWELSSIAELQTFHTGGIVGQPGTSSEDVLALVQPGEGYIDANTMRRLKSGGGTTNMGGVTIIQHFRFNGQVGAREVMSAARQGVKEGSKNLQRYTRSGYTA